MSDATINIGLPPGKSALYMMSRARYQHSLADGDVVSEDGWVYRDNQRAFKWFDFIVPECCDPEEMGFRVWKPALKDIKRIEALYWRIATVYNAYLEKRWPKLMERFQQTPLAAYIPQKPRDDGYTHYLVRHFFAGKDSVREHGWKKGEPPADACPLLGQDYWNYWCNRQGRRWQLSKRKTQLKTALKLAFEAVLPQLPLHANTQEEHQANQEKIHSMLGQLTRLQINGRYYWYELHTTPFGGVEWDVVHWPDTELVEVNLDK